MRIRIPNNVVVRFRMTQDSGRGLAEGSIRETIMMQSLQTNNYPDPKHYLVSRQTVVRKLLFAGEVSSYDHFSFGQQSESLWIEVFRDYYCKVIQSSNLRV